MDQQPGSGAASDAEAGVSSSRMLRAGQHTPRSHALTISPEVAHASASDSNLLLKHLTTLVKDVEMILGADDTSQGADLNSHEIFMLDPPGQPNIRERLVLFAEGKQYLQSHFDKHYDLLSDRLKYMPSVFEAGEEIWKKGQEGLLKGIDTVEQGVGVVGEAVGTQVKNVGATVQNVGATVN